MNDSLHRAYAALGLDLGASVDQVKSQYRKLVKRWHPDRFGFDPKGRKEAEDRLRGINGAYKVIQDALGRGHISQTRPAPPAGPRRGTASSRLTREEIDRIVAALGNEGPVIAALRFVHWFWPIPVGIVLMYHPRSYAPYATPEQGALDALGIGLFALALVLWLLDRRGRRSRSI